MEAAQLTQRCDEGRALILAELEGCSDLTVVRGPARPEDELALDGYRKLLSDRRYRLVDLDALCTARGEVALLAAGKGFSGAGTDWARWALAIAELRFERVIVLPCSFDVSQRGVRETLVSSQAVIFAREPASLEAISDLCPARLALDGAFYRDYERVDGRGSGTLDAFGHGGDRLQAMGTLTEWLEEIARHDRIRTDRAEVLTAASLMGRRVELTADAPDEVRALADFAGLAVTEASPPPRVTKPRGEPDADPALSARHGTELVMLVVPDVGLGSDTVGLLAAELDAHPEAIAAAPAVVAPDGKVVHCGGDIREHDPVVEFPLRDAGTAPAALRSRPSAPCAWAPATALLIRASALEQSPFDPEMAPYEAAEAFYRLTPPDGARVRACPGIQVGLRHRPAEPDLGEERLLWYCRVLPRLIGAARFHRRHDLVITDVFEILPELVRSDGVQDRAAAILVLELLDGIGPARFLMRWVRGELDPLLKAGALADRLSRAEDELDYAARHLEAVLGTRAWRLIRRLYRARDRVRR